MRQWMKRHHRGLLIMLAVLVESEQILLGSHR